MSERQQINYTPLPTLKRFHESGAIHRCMVGPVGSGKTSAAAIEIGYYLPMWMYENFGIKKTRWAIIRNTYKELTDSTLKSIQDTWFPWGNHRVQKSNYDFVYPNGVTVDFWLRACDRPDQVKMFKSMEVTGVWLEESIEIVEETKNMLVNRIGRFPAKCPVKFVVESTNPPDVEHPLFSNYKWIIPPPDVVPTRQPLDDHEGFWQPPYENTANLNTGYYEDLKKAYRDSPEWLDMYVLGKPGAMIKGKLVYYDFTKEKHVSGVPLVWHRGKLYRGWDNTGNHPGCVVLQMVGHNKIHVLKEFHSDRMGILDFAEWVVVECNQLFENATYTDYADPAGENKVASPLGGLTSNGDMMREFGISVIPSDQNWEARREAVQKQIGIEGGLLVDPSCTRLINGFIAGYAYPQIGTTGVYKDKPMKNKYSDVHDSLQYALCKIFRSQKGRMKAKAMARRLREHRKRLDVPGL